MMHTQQTPSAPQPVAHDHDLPVLASEQNPPVCPDWDALLSDGVQPALVLGADRRWRGCR